MVAAKRGMAWQATSKKFAKKQASINLRGVDRVLAVAGVKMIPSVKGRFLRCLEVCAFWYNDAIRFNHGAPQKEQREYISRLRSALHEVASLLDEDAIPTNLRSILPRLAPFSSLLSQVGELDPKLKRIETLRSDTLPCSGLESDFIDALQYQDHFKERSPFDWLAGVYLPEVFYLFFPVHLGWGKGKQFLSFAESVLREMNVRTGAGSLYSRKAISRSVRLNKVRRKAGPLVDKDVPDQLEWYRHMYLMSAIGKRSKMPKLF
jgi:hypothetical protein